MLNATFVMDQNLGLRTTYENLRRYIDSMPDVCANWVEVSWVSERSKWSRLPFVPAHLRAAFVAREQVRSGFHGHAADVALFHTQVLAAYGGGVVSRQPYLLYTDLTPVQLDEKAHIHGHRADESGPIKWYKHQTNLRMMQGASKVVGYSHWVARSFIDDYGVDPSRVEVIPPGVDLDIWRPIEKTNQGPMRILFVGGDFHRKGGDDVLAAFRTLPAGMAELLLVTRAELPSEPGITVFNHLQPNMPELTHLFQTSDVFVLPSKAEPFGIAAVEASASAVPVIATAVDGLSDIVVDGETGLVMPPGDVGVLASHFRMLAENHGLRRRLGRAARARAERCYDAKINAVRFAYLLREAVGIPEERLA